MRGIVAQHARLPEDGVPVAAQNDLRDVFPATGTHTSPFII